MSMGPPKKRASLEAEGSRPEAVSRGAAPEKGTAGIPSGTPGGGVALSRMTESLLQRGGPKPVWRSLLSPQAGQRALALNPETFELFESLSEAGVHMEWDPAVIRDRSEAPFDLVLEDRSQGSSSRRPGRIRPFLARGGRWVMVMQGRPFVGWLAWVALLQARRERFDTIETYYAHPSLRSPHILVPLDRPEPFLYFLRLAVGVHTVRQRLLTLGLRVLCILGFHREVLPNLIVVARRKK